MCVLFFSFHRRFREAWGACLTWRVFSLFVLFCFILFYFVSPPPSLFLSIINKQTNNILVFSCKKFWLCFCHVFIFFVCFVGLRVWVCGCVGLFFFKCLVFVWFSNFLPEFDSSCLFFLFLSIFLIFSSS